MQPFKKATQKLDEVTAVGADLRETAQWATSVAICISCVSLAALLLATLALRKANSRAPF